MMRMLPIAVLFAAVLPVAASSPTRLVASGAAIAPERVWELAALVAPKVLQWRRDFHAHPELSNREKRTSAEVARILKELGVDEVRTGVARYGVVALIKGSRPGPVVALRADMDALPVTEATGLPFASKNSGVMHACGHDAHTAILLGAASVLAQMRNDLHGTVKLVFQPAEEGPPSGEEGGARLMVKEGVLKTPDVSAIFALHISGSDIEAGKIGYVFGGALASAERFRIVVKGKGTHGARPWQGLNPVAVGARIVEALDFIPAQAVDARETFVVTAGSLYGGTRWNIIPETATIEGTIRTLNEEVRRKGLEVFERIVRRTAEAYGATVELTLDSIAPVTRNDPELGRRTLASFAAAAGAGNVQEWIPITGAEDFAFYSEQVPAFYFWLGARNEAIGASQPHHTERFMIDESVFPIGVRAMSLVALDYLRQEAVRKASGG